MSDLQFEEEDKTMTFKSRKILGEAQIPKIVQYLIDKGVSRDTKQAYYLLLSIAIISLVLSIAVYMYFIVGVGAKEKTEYKIPMELQIQIKANQANENSVTQ